MSPSQDVLRYRGGVELDAQRSKRETEGSPVMLINGRYDPIVTPGDALQLAAAARSLKTVLYFNGGRDPFALGSDSDKVTRTATRFLMDSLNLPARAL